MYLTDVINELNLFYVYLSVQKQGPLYEKKVFRNTLGLIVFSCGQFSMLLIKLLQIQLPKATHLYDLTVSMGQESGCSLVWVLGKTAIKVLARTGLFIQSLGRGRVCFQAPSLRLLAEFISSWLLRSCQLASSKPAKERLARWAGATLLCKYVHVITQSPLPLLHSIGYKQVTGPAHTQGGGNDRKV